MGLKVIDMAQALTPIEFLVPELFPFGYVSFVAAREGGKKTTLLSGLGWQMTRPEGGEFLGQPVRYGPVVYLNTDAADGEGRSVRYWLDQHKAAFPDGNTAMFTTLENTEIGLTEADVAELASIMKASEARCLIIDSFMGSFPGLESNKLSSVMKSLVTLGRLASTTGAAVIIADHLPKKAVGEQDGDRGIMGSVGKSAQARAIHVLTRIPPKEVEGREVLRWEVRKASFARDQYSLGVEIVRTHDTVTDQVSMYATPYRLPDDSNTETRGARAAAAVLAHLQERGGALVTHAALLALAMQEGNLHERAAQDAVRGALKTLKDSVVTEKLKGRGTPLAYRLKGKQDSDCQTATNTLEAMQDGISFVAASDCQDSEPATEYMSEDHAVAERTGGIPDIQADETEAEEALPWAPATDPAVMSATPPTLKLAEMPSHLAGMIEAARAGTLPAGPAKLPKGTIPSPAEFVLEWAKGFPGDNAKILSELEAMYIWIHSSPE